MPFFSWGKPKSPDELLKNEAHKAAKSQRTVRAAARADPFNLVQPSRRPLDHLELVLIFSNVDHDVADVLKQDEGKSSPSLPLDPLQDGARETVTLREFALREVQRKGQQLGLPTETALRLAVMLIHSPVLYNGVIPDTVGSPLREIAGRVPIEVVLESPMASYIERKGDLPDSFWTTLSAVKPAMVEGVRSGLIQVFIRLFTDPKQHAQEGAVFFFYRSR